MRPIYHILGSDIPHHNRTVLNFFRDQLLPKLTEQQHYFYVVGQQTLLTQYPELNLQVFCSRQAITRAVVQTAKQVKTAKFVLHGQYNVWLWIAVLFGYLPACRCIWHIWGADLYEEASGWKFKLFYFIRRLAQQKLPVLWATRGDLTFAKRHLNRTDTQDRVLYFPTKMGSRAVMQDTRENQRFTILLGNSGDPSNRHLAALAQLKQSLAEDVRIIIPMGYPSNNQTYIEQVKRQAVELFPKHTVEVLTEKLDFTQYQQLLAQCDLGYFYFNRQQAIGTICLLIQQNVPLALTKENPFCIDMQAENVPFLYSDELTIAKVRKVKQQLQNCDKNNIGFFAPHYNEQWLTLLTELSKS
ncbi:TDP-N-acetylfucosamine:lipid II N-acetylfucosaminyltransferase [Actinobacillus pleuropneumoniae]|uniref:TDP-N-acetylfucosamine:lipid II N-acetylfucosaminyltransferase n=1 Tax=Actinobacillus pleuropneumoniae TaxID=715 RepID=UPI001F27C63D|nr:TDP-N-acetylfucosamine:lipid II N-acetylfucosaminyltransferase [Actinobacillus pleuropneumoniae]UKH17031.1 TDP-N-acetylfucosamine:lipid II N-acetylfucosaminyltransferase [Actinobacillus pleuropneumoniae]